jgi:hypothetical protein
MALIIWLSKRQPTIETSVFGAEFVAMKHGIETLRGLRYKLRMMGVPLTGPTFIYGDNKSQSGASCHGRLIDDEFMLLLGWLKSSRNTEIKYNRSAWIQSMHQGMGKGAETEATRMSSLEWFKMQQGGVKE